MERRRCQLIEGLFVSWMRLHAKIIMEHSWTYIIFSMRWGWNFIFIYVEWDPFGAEIKRFWEKFMALWRFVDEVATRIGWLCGDRGKYKYYTVNVEEREFFEFFFTTGYKIIRYIILWVIQARSH